MKSEGLCWDSTVQSLLSMSTALGSTPSNKFLATLWWAWQCTPAIPALRRLRQKDRELEVSPGYTVRENLSQTNLEHSSWRLGGMASWFSL